MLSRNPRNFRDGGQKLIEQISECKYEVAKIFGRHLDIKDARPNGEFVEYIFKKAEKNSDLEWLNMNRRGSGVRQLDVILQCTLPSQEKVGTKPWLAGSDFGFSVPQNLTNDHNAKTPKPESQPGSQHQFIFGPTIGSRQLVLRMFDLYE